MNPLSTDNDTPSPDHAADHAGDHLVLNAQQAEAIVRVVEAAPQVRRRYQFFVWTQNQLQTLLPHQLLACGAYQRQKRDLVFEAFHSVVLPAEVMALLTDLDAPLLPALMAAWVEGRGRPLVLEPGRVPPGRLADAAAVLRAQGIDALVVHGVSRPQRPSELESFFVFAQTSRTAAASMAMHLELMLPHLHTTWLRVTATERELAQAVPRPKAVAAPVGQRSGKPAGITDRERQILRWVREGKSNQQISEVLGISPLTVKNHVQKILRKLAASNRAQAVAQAMQLGLLEGGTP